MSTQPDGAIAAGKHAGWQHANYVEAYGEDNDTECPAWHADDKTYWDAAYAEGRKLFENGLYLDGTPMGDAS